MSAEHPIVNISTQPIELCKLLKIANMVSGGGEAKIVISEGYVYLNGEVEFQKRKKVYDNDIVEFNGEIIQVACSNAPLQTSEKPAKAAKTKSKSTKNNGGNNRKNNKSRSQNIEKGSYDNEFDSAPATPPKRRPISF